MKGANIMTMTEALDKVHEHLQIAHETSTRNDSQSITETTIAHLYLELAKILKELEYK